MKTAINTLIDNLQSELNGMGIDQYNLTDKCEIKKHNAIMKSFSYCINEAKKLIELEKQQICDAVNQKYENLNLKAEKYYTNKFE